MKLFLRKWIHLVASPWWFSNFRWWRFLWGGHWERWYVEVCHSEVWHDVKVCSKVTGERPGGCFGTPQCECYK